MLSTNQTFVPWLRTARIRQPTFCQQTSLGNLTDGVHFKHHRDGTRGRNSLGRSAFCGPGPVRSRRRAPTQIAVMSVRAGVASPSAIPISRLNPDIAPVNRYGQWAGTEGMVPRRKHVIPILALILPPIVGSSQGSAQNIDIDRLIGAFVGGAIRQPGGDVDRRRLNPDMRQREPLPRSDPRFAGIGSAYPYSVAGLKLGDRPLSLDDYQCEPSVVMENAFWCQKSARNTSANGNATISDKLLVSNRQGIRFASRYVEPAFFQPGEVTDEVTRLRARFRDQGRMTVYGAGGRNPPAVLVTWGDIVLRQLIPSEMDAIRSNTFKARGFYLDYMNDPLLSAQRSMPVYQISGGPGFFWISNSDDTGVGSLRFGMIDVNYGAGSPEPPRQVTAGQGDFAAPQERQSVPAMVGSGAPVAPPPSDFAAVAPQGAPQAVPRAIAPSPATPPSSDFASQPGISAAVSLTGKDASAPTAPDAVKTVDVTGYGETVDAARSDAARQAVQQVAGVYVDNRRRIDENVTDQKVSTVVSEKVLSYTNAYVTRLDVGDVANSKGLFTMHAHVSVAVSPLIKTLNDNNIPTVAFDTNSAVATATTAAAEKADAEKLYMDLLDRVSDLVIVSVGTPKPLINLPASADHIWLQIPMTYFANKDAIAEWRKKMALIAQSVTQVEVESKTVTPYSMRDCKLPEISADQTIENARHSDFYRSSIPGTFSTGICFADSDTPNGLSSTCYRRDFSHSVGNPSQCRDDSACPSLGGKASGVRTTVEFLAKDGSVVYSIPSKFSDFPHINVSQSRTEPENTGSAGFRNFCVGRHDLFYTYKESFSNHPELLIMPLPNSRLDSYFTVQVPIDKVASIASVRAQVIGH